jgi:nickel/cobalt exporter
MSAAIGHRWAVRVFLVLGLILALALLALWGTGALEAAGRQLALWQRAAQDQLAGPLRGLKSGAPGAWAALMGACFAYGFLHAAGPGHGKMVIGGYGLVGRIRLWPLLGLALASSLAQAAAAVVLVAAGIWLLGWGRDRLEWASGEVLAPAGTWAIIALGGWILVRGGLRLWRQLAKTGSPGEAHGNSHGHGHGHEDHPHGHHTHGPSLQEIEAASGWREATILVAAIAIRPCTGAIFVLIVTAAMGIFAAGIAGAFAMGLGTAAVTILVAGLTVWAREGALVNLPGSSLARALPLIEVLAGLAVVVAAALLLGRGG